MKNIPRLPVAVLLVAGASALALASPALAANPCAGQNVCAPKSAGVAKAVKRPADYRPFKGDHAELTRRGESLFKDPKLSTNGMACASCHQAYGAFKASFAKPFPHRIAMADQNFGFKEIHLDEMVQICMIGPMANRPLAWESKELAALTAYLTELQKGFKPGGGR